ESYAVLDRHCSDAIKRYLTEKELHHLIGPGVSAAAIWYLREKLDEANFHHVPIVASSGFTPEKCRIMAFAHAPVALIGTGSFLPQRWAETYATADIIAYDGVNRVKIGREFLFSPKQEE
ncbi:MAG: nicotinate phosphoribosyltransferase, partial [Pseudomonadota bacterium]